MENCYTVSEYNKQIKNVLQAGFRKREWIIGEIQGYNRNKDKGHIFFEIVEKEKENQEVKSRISVVIFATHKRKIQLILRQSDDRLELKDDMEVKFQCQMSFYEKAGQVRLIIDNIDPIYTIGKIARDRKKLIQKLKREGILDKNKQLVLSKIPLNIGLITSGDSAAYNDFISEMKKEEYAFKIFFKDSIMQGKKTENEICFSIEELEKEDINVIIIIRGGGSTADLSDFDNERIIRTIAKSKIPIITGIGHQIDTTLSDMASFHCEKTPTATASFLVNRVKDNIELLNNKKEKLIIQLEQYLKKQKQQIQEKIYRIQILINECLKSRIQKIVKIREYFKNKPKSILHINKKEIQYKKEILLIGVNRIIKTKKEEINHYKKIIKILSPENTLNRGYTLIRDDNNRIIKTKEEIKDTSNISIQFRDGIYKL